MSDFGDLVSSRSWVSKFAELTPLAAEPLARLQLTRSTYRQVFSALSLRLAVIGPAHFASGHVWMVVVGLWAADALQTLGTFALVRGARQTFTLRRGSRLMSVRVGERYSNKARENRERQRKRQQNGTSLHLKPPVPMHFGRRPMNPIQCHAGQRERR
jgi:hypothetical protein